MNHVCIGMPTQEHVPAGYKNILKQRFRESHPISMKMLLQETLLMETPIALWTMTDHPVHKFQFSPQELYPMEKNPIGVFWLFLNKHSDCECLCNMTSWFLNKKIPLICSTCLNVNQERNYLTSWVFFRFFFFFQYFYTAHLPSKRLAKRRSRTQSTSHMQYHLNLQGWQPVEDYHL